MPERLTPQQEGRFAAELGMSSLTALRAAALIAILSFVAFGVVDRWLVEGPLHTHYLVRGILVVLLLGALGLASVPGFAARRVTLLVILTCQVTGQGVNALTALTGGGDGRYHDALILTILAYGLLPFPWSPRLAGACFSSLLLGYILILGVTGTRGALGNFVTNCAILSVSVLLGTLATWLMQGARRQEFTQREKLAAANERLAALDRAKSRFFANLSHELRTPLTLALAPVQSLLGAPDPAWQPEHRQRLRLVERNALRLLRLVDDLLELTRAEGAALRLRPEEFDLRELAVELCEQVGPVAAQKGLQVAVEPGTGPSTIRADQRQIERVLLNLLGNAVKFTDSGGLSVRVEPVPGGMEICVADSGIGIPPEERERIFDRFHQVDPSPTRRHGGTGIGLSLAREIVELHHGTIRAEARPEGGTLMRVFLPVAADDSPGVASIERRRAQRTAGTERREAPTGLPEWHEALRREPGYRFAEVSVRTEDRTPAPPGIGTRSVLVVEDNPDMIEFLSQLLSAEYRVLGANNGRQGLVLAVQRRPDLILSDVMMPEMNGLQLVEALRAEATTRDIPVILLTARGELEDRVQGRGVGADAYLCKPFQPVELLAAVRSLLGRHVAVAERGRRDRDEGVAALAGGIVEALRGPLQHLRIGGGGVPADRQDAMDTVLQRVDAALGDLAIYAAGSSEGRLSLVGVDDVLRQIVPKLEPDGGRRVEVVLGSTSWVRVRREDVERVLVGLLRQALHVTRPGGLVRVETRDEARRWVSVIVRDEGPGVPDTHAERIFLPYDRAAGDGALGLALWRRIIEAHGGELVLQRGAEIGATFVLRLPVSAPDSAPAP